MTNTRVHIYVSGRVQGVFFRANAARKADSLGVTGWVKNLSDGRVELLVEGETDTVNRMILWCRRGPPGADVESVDVETLPFKGEFSDFRVAY